MHGRKIHRTIQKKTAFKAWKATLKKKALFKTDEYLPEYYLIRAAMLYAKETAKSEERYIKHPSSFLNGEYWTELLEKVGLNEKR